LKDYERNFDKRERFQDIHNDVVNKFWKKYQVERYDKKDNKPRNSIIDDLNNFNAFNKQGHTANNFFNS